MSREAYKMYTLSIGNNIINSEVVQLHTTINKKEQIFWKIKFFATIEEIQTNVIKKLDQFVPKIFILSSINFF